ncbi:MAG TPA: MurR/RpiR family transcriptional regulator [Ilumatobacter sp.]|nr:MurR/RpiR family transcriptional regulator [Ilumatobacter sp.]
MEVAERIRAGGATLTTAERRVAEVILGSPHAVGFGTVAELARTAGVGAATVVRLSAKLGYEGFSELQTGVQRDLMHQLRPAAERIREAGDDARADHSAIEVANVTGTLKAVNGRTLTTLIDRLADLDRPVALLSGDDSAGVAHQFVTQLVQIRPGVTSLYGSQVIVHRDIALLDPRTTVIVIDLRRYEQWVLDAHGLIRARGLWSAALSDNALSPLAAFADVAFDISAGSAGPFDSHVGTLALLNLFVANVAARVREPAAERLAAIEAAWREHGSLVVRDQP